MRTGAMWVAEYGQLYVAWWMIGAIVGYAVLEDCSIIHVIDES